jgi:hypothetical protein
MNCRILRDRHMLIYDYRVGPRSEHLQDQVVPNSCRSADLSLWLSLQAKFEVDGSVPPG